MNAVEIVHLRSSGEPLESLAERIKESIWAEGSNTQVVTVYRRYGLATDVAIHVRHLEATGKNEPSILAFHLAQALREFGLVEHSVWEEMT